jgi:DNA (cytosine-5)-methyltransferase 1
MPIHVVDIFAGPGGLGEGFSSYVPDGRSEPAFKISVSAEMETNAARTLRLRSFFRQFPAGEVPESYYEYVRGNRDTPWTEATRAEWEASCEEALQLTLGIAEHDQILADRVAKVARRSQPWVLVGGPPCQAYSLVGRSRNKGNQDYRPEEDERHFLYRHYLELIRKFNPAVFVMENVKGILSSKVGGSLIFPQIMRDLSRPGGRGGPRYHILPLVAPRSGSEDDGSRFILRAEELGVPQARHRVILLGISEELGSTMYTPIAAGPPTTHVEHVIRRLPRRRSGITKRRVQLWPWDTERILLATARIVQRTEERVAEELIKAARKLPASDPGSGGRWAPWAGDLEHLPAHLREWLHDPRLGGILNHEVRAHMADDLKRYAYVAAFTQVHKSSPKGPDDFPAALYPDHQSWGGGGFSDRFKAQAWKRPSSTITSHLSKDGHYFIHPDTSQLRSISVREAARLQTFPDNYFFEGSRGAQFRQVGNAVPPWMAHQIAGVVYSALTSR